MAPEMRIVIVAFDYRSENLRLLPWRCVHALCGELSKLGHEVSVLTDGYPTLPMNSFLGGVPVVRLRHVKHFPPSSFREITHAISSADPDAIVWLMGLTAFFQTKLFRQLKRPIVALFTSPVYWRREILRNIGRTELFREKDLLAPSLLGALIPRFLIRKTYNSRAIRKIVVMSRETKNRLESMGIDPQKIIHIPFGLDREFLESPSEEQIVQARSRACEDGQKMLVTYFGPPLSSRGVDTLLLGTKFALQRHPSLDQCLRILILSRRRDNEYSASASYLQRLLDRFELHQVVKVESGFQREEDLKAYIAASDLVTLPFKYVISDVPLGIMEALSLGKPVLSTCIDGIPELLENGRGLVIEPRDFESLGRIILHFSRNMQELKRYGHRARRFAHEQPTSKDSSHSVLSLIRDLT